MQLLSNVIGALTSQSSAATSYQLGDLLILVVGGAYLLSGALFTVVALKEDTKERIKYEAVVTQ